MLLSFLLVDDSSTFRGMIKKTLRLSGVPVGRVFEAANGKEALAIVEREWVDLILADVHMPVMAGSELVARLSSDPVLKSIPVILLTSEGNTPRVEAMKSQGVCAYLRKPCSPEALREAVVGVIGLGDSPRLDNVVKKVFPDVVQSLVYMLCDEGTRHEAVCPGGSFLEAGIRFESDGIRGGMSLLAPYDLCLRMASNILGADPSAGDSGEGAKDALREVVNVTCGHVVTSMIGESSVCDLGVPVVEDRDRRRWDLISSDPGTRVFYLEDLPVLLSFDLEGSEPAGAERSALSSSMPSSSTTLET
jgi:two-component system chemotaxis response regulator CheY